MNNGQFAPGDERTRELASKAGKASARARAARGRGNGEALTVSADETPGAITDLDACVRWSAWLANAAVTGMVDSRTADVATRAIREFRQSSEAANVAEEVAALRAELAELRGAS